MHQAEGFAILGRTGDQHPAGVGNEGELAGGQDRFQGLADGRRLQPHAHRIAQRYSGRRQGVRIDRDRQRAQRRQRVDRLAQGHVGKLDLGDLAGQPGLHVDRRGGMSRGFRRGGLVPHLVRSGRMLLPRRGVLRRADLGPLTGRTGGGRLDLQGGRRDLVAAVDRGQLLQHAGIDVLRDEADGAVGHAGRHAVGLPAAKTVRSVHVGPLRQGPHGAVAAGRPGAAAVGHAQDGNGVGAPRVMSSTRVLRP